MTVSASVTDPATMTVTDLLDHIEARFQEAHRQLLPELVALARKVERVHHDVADAPLGLAEALERLGLALDMHMDMEAHVLFPAMRHNLHSTVAHPIALMRSEHEGYEQEIAAVAALAHHGVVPEGACGSWQRLYAGVAALCATLREQIRIENEILFPRFEIAAATRCTCAHG